jgi:hypothetical protein
MGSSDYTIFRRKRQRIDLARFAALGGFGRRPAFERIGAMWKWARERVIPCHWACYLLTLTTFI